MGLVGFGLGITDAPLDDRLIDGIGLGGLLRHQAQPDKQTFECSEHSLVLCETYFFVGSSFSRRIFSSRMNSSCWFSCFSSAAPTTVTPIFLSGAKTFASTSKATKWTNTVAPLASDAWRIRGTTIAGSGPTVLTPSVMTSTCFWVNLDWSTARPADSRVRPSGVPLFGPA